MKVHYTTSGKHAQEVEDFYYTNYGMPTLGFNRWGWIQSHTLAPHPKRKKHNGKAFEVPKSILELYPKAVFSLKMSGSTDEPHHYVGTTPKEKIKEFHLYFILYEAI